MKHRGNDGRHNDEIGFRKAHTDQTQDDGQEETDGRADEQRKDNAQFELQDEKDRPISPGSEENGVPQTALIGKSEGEIIAHGEDGKNNHLDDQGPDAAGKNKPDEHQDQKGAQDKKGKEGILLHGRITLPFRQKAPWGGA